MLIACWSVLALQGEGMVLCILVCSSAAAPRFGAMWSRCSLVFSFAPSMPCRALYKCNYLYLMIFILKKRGKKHLIIGQF
ncbi:hypothetical protein [Escherichia coli]|uniref:hypothetical protein n=1 Tax=Escherichia coli TaxID=562 RepID=UPI00320ADED6